VGTSPERVSVSPAGQVRVGGQQVGQLQIVTLAGAAKTADSLWQGRPAGPAVGTVTQRSLESSNTDATRTVFDMIASQRSFESSQRVLRTMDDTLQRSAQIASVQ
jgi:flagellar basal-body rod protein FlgG